MGQRDLILSLSLYMFSFLHSSLLFWSKFVSPLAVIRFTGFPIFFLLQRGLITCQCCLTLIKEVQSRVFSVYVDLRNRWVTNTQAAGAVTLWSSWSHGPTERWAAPLLGDGASDRAGDMLGQRSEDHRTEVCYYSKYCSNHGKAMEDCSGLHRRYGPGSNGDRRRSQRWVC